MATANKSIRSTLITDLSPFSKCIVIDAELFSCLFNADFVGELKCL